MILDSYHISIANATDVGMVREHNEDYMAHFETSIGYCIVICDGMGGHAAGDVASQNAIAAIKMYLQDEKNAKLKIPKVLNDTIEFANYKLREMVQLNPDLTGMGTTCILALINKEEMFVAHAGDSRLYLLRDNEIKQISKDHSTVQNLIDAGVLTEEEAERSDKKNQITKALGIFEKAAPSITEVPVHLMYDDKILLCSDGLTGHVSNRLINETILENKEMQAAAVQLIDEANKAGGTDNITVQIIHYTGKSSSNILKHKQIRKYAMAGLIILVLAAVVIGYLKFFVPKKGDGNEKSELQNNEVRKVITSINDTQPDLKVPAKTDAKLKEPQYDTANDSTYEVKYGDVLSIIGKKFHISVIDLKNINQLENDDIKERQILIIRLNAKVKVPRINSPKQ